MTSIKNLRFLLIPALVLIPKILFAHDVSEGDQQILDNGGLLAYLWVGAKHMLTGYDHLLFLGGVIFYLKNFKDIIKFITVFTLGHSITLIGATYLGIKVDEHLIDAVIGLSVLYKGFENLGGFEKVFKVKSPNLLAMVFSFGLIHGLGLSTRLQSFAMGEENILAKIISFNVGVELGQVAALIPIIFVINFWRQKESYNAFYKASNVYLVLAGIALTAFQLWGYFGGAH
ncbi:HupE/UreJ family protein [Algoriphagus sediminis]|uniref:HupE/UreJ family protein n=1 Tax=Algoriphagus sediminis TaxID=3057113 RepID=A0ABT7YC50_9BACT|nr:HupE/UreJ family protein [Algoriphagus sediminis]MDN3204058.1 HupE/UreJ family protein [Algoriphagus sediminis]